MIAVDREVSGSRRDRGYLRENRSMELDVADTSVTIRLTRDEALRMGVALAVGCDVSRAEYYIRTGLAMAQVRLVARALTDAHKGPSGSHELVLTAGQEDVENPRRPRPLH